MIKVNSIPA